MKEIKIILHLLIILHLQIGKSWSARIEDCAVNCAKRWGEMAEEVMWYSASPTSSLPLSTKNIEIGPGKLNASCPPATDRAALNKLQAYCGATKEVTKCYARCPEDPFKNGSAIAMKPVQFMCIYKLEDVKRHFPCLSRGCESIQQICVPKCGSLDNLARQLTAIANKELGDENDVEPTIYAAVVSAASAIIGSSRSSSNNEMMRVLGQLCRTADCHLDCAKRPTIEKCGNDSYALTEDLTMSIFTATNTYIHTFGSTTSARIPVECKGLISEEIAEVFESTQFSGAAACHGSTFLTLWTCWCLVLLFKLKFPVICDNVL